MARVLQITVPTFVSATAGRGERIGDVTLAEALFVCGIMLLPYDALPVFPSTYRPVAIIPLGLSLLLCLADRSAHVFFGNGMRLLLFFAYVTISSAVGTLILRSDAGSFAEVVLTLFIGVVVFFSFFANMRNKRLEVGTEGLFDWLFLWISRAYVVPLLVGMVEVASLLGLLPGSVNDSLVSVFGGNQWGRLTLTSYEASWASYHLALAAVAYLYRYWANRGAASLAGLIMSVGLFAFTQSMQGFLVLGAAVVVFAVWLSCARGNFLTLVKWCAAITTIACIVVLVLTVVYSSQGGLTYYSARFLGFSGLDQLVRTDGSSFVRIMFPVIGMRMFLDNPLFGVGGGRLPGRPSRVYLRPLPVCACVRGDSEERRRHPYALGCVRLHEGVCRAWDFWCRALLWLLPAMRGRDSRAWGQGAAEMHDNRIYVHLPHVHAAPVRELRVRPVLACSCAVCCAWPLECFRAAARSRGGDRA